MKITKIKVEHFRSIKQTEISTSDFNIFVGQNNCGKTNLFEAIDFFFNPPGKSVKIDDLKFKKDASNELIVEIEFDGAILAASKMQKAPNKTKIENALNGHDIVSFKRSSVEPTKRKMLVNGQEVTPGTGFDQALNEFLPKFEYINTKQYYDSVAKYARTTPIGVMLSAVLTTILEHNQQYQDFQNKFKELFEDDESEIKAQFDTISNKVKVHLEKQFPDCTKVNFEVSAPALDDLLKNFDTTIDDGVETAAEEKGDGMQRALMLAIIQTYANYRKTHDDADKSFLFFIDEAELHLHPTAQRKLKEVLYELSKANDQVFINTHSSVLVADNYDRQNIYKVEKNEGESKIEIITDEDKPNLIFDLLGGSPADLLLPRNFLIVEGQSEFEFFSRIMNRFYNDRPKIQIIKANGDIDQAERTINAIEKAFTPLNTSMYKNKLVILTDQPHPDRQAGVDQFLNTFEFLRGNNQFYQLTVRDIEQYYPDQVDPTYINWRKTQAQVDGMSGHQKKQLAKQVGDNITREQFENDMNICFNALNKCFNEAFE